VFLSSDAWPPTAVVDKVHVPVSSPVTSAFPQSDGVGCSTKLRSTTSERRCFRSGSHSIMFKPPSLLPLRSFPPLASTLDAGAAVAFTSEQNAVRCLPAHRICWPSEWAIDGEGLSPP
jgi:hypothetical protein